MGSLLFISFWLWGLVLARVWFPRRGHERFGMVTSRNLLISLKLLSCSPGFVCALSWQQRQCWCDSTGDLLRSTWLGLDALVGLLWAGTDGGSIRGNLLLHPSVWNPPIFLSLKSKYHKAISSSLQTWPAIKVNSVKMWTTVSRRICFKTLISPEMEGKQCATRKLSLAPVSMATLKVWMPGRKKMSGTNMPQNKRKCEVLSHTRTRVCLKMPVSDVSHPDKPGNYWEHACL